MIAEFKPDEKDIMVNIVMQFFDGEVIAFLKCGDCVTISFNIFYKNKNIGKLVYIATMF